jgi:hypothetical protein
LNLQYAVRNCTPCKCDPGYLFQLDTEVGLPVGDYRVGCGEGTTTSGPTTTVPPCSGSCSWQLQSGVWVLLSNTCSPSGCQCFADGLSDPATTYEGSTASNACVYDTIPTTTTTTTTTTTAAPCSGNCAYEYDSVSGWIQLNNACSNGCGCDTASLPGSPNIGDIVTVGCIPAP